MSCRESSDREGVRVEEGHVGVVVSVKQGPGPAQDWGRLGIIAEYPKIVTVKWLTKGSIHRSGFCRSAHLTC